MDRQIPVSVRRKRLQRKLLITGIISISLIIFFFIVSFFLKDSLSLKALDIDEADQGTIEISISASGKLSPMLEEVVVSPINSRILEVYKNASDTVEAGEPLLKLDLTSVETEYKQKLDEQEIMKGKLLQLQVKLENTLSELSIQQQIKEMNLQLLASDLINEKHLDSIGAGTMDKVRRARLAHDEAKLELQQLRQRIENEKRTMGAELNMQQLELSIFEKTLSEKARLLKDARILSPQKATLTFINNQIGAQVTQGSEIAIVADLTRFKVDAEISDGHREKLHVGSKTVIEIGDIKLTGTVVTIKPSVTNGLVEFTVKLDDSGNPKLRSGLKANIHVSYGRKQDVIRIPNKNQFKHGKGEYTLWVVNGKQAERRRVSIGESSYEYVEIIRGLHKGERIILSDMDKYKNRETIQIN